MDYIKAFLIGGMICALAQVLLDRTRLMRAVSWFSWLSVAVFWDLPVFMSRLPDGQEQERQFLFWDLATPYGKV